MQIGEAVIIVSENRHDYLVSVLGVCLAGGRAVLCDATISVETLVKRMQVTHAKFIISSKSELDMSASCLAKAEAAIALFEEKYMFSLH